MTTNAKNAAKPMMTHVTFLIERSDGTDDVGEYTVLGALNNSEMLIPEEKFAEICREFQARLQLLTDEKVIVQHREDLIDILQIESAEFAKGVLPEFEAAISDSAPKKIGEQEPVRTLGPDAKLKVVPIEYSVHPVEAGEGADRSARRFYFVMDAYGKVQNGGNHSEEEDDTFLKDLITDVFHYYSNREWPEPDFQLAEKVASTTPLQSSVPRAFGLVNENFEYWDVPANREHTNDERAQRIADVGKLHARAMGVEQPDWPQFLADLATYARINDFNLMDVVERAESAFEDEVFEETRATSPSF
jgi:hypothetical protein